MMDLAIYLSLTPEFGGTRFGPFEKLETRLGSDEDRCHIVLPESLGVLPVHVQVLRQGETNTIVAPADRSATVFLWRKDERRPIQITSPTALRSGDAFSLVTENGPRFVMEIDHLPPEIQEERNRTRGTHGRSRLSTESMGQEIQRQAWTSILTQAPAQMAQRAWTFIRSGAIYQPRNIIMGFTLLGGWIIGGWAFCGRSDQISISESWQSQYEECNVERQVLEDISETPIADQTFAQLAFLITNSTSLTAYLDTDSGLIESVIQKAKEIESSGQTQYQWLLGASGRDFQRFQRWRDRIVNSDNYSEDIRTLAVWLAATWPSTGDQNNGRTNRGGRGERHTMTTFGDDRVCLRGPLPLSARMAVRLGLEAPVEGLFDIPNDGEDGDIDDESEMLTFINDVYTQDWDLDSPEGITVNKERVGNDYCVYVEGEDDRASESTLSRALVPTLGNNASNVPEEDSPFGPISRIAKFWSSAMPWGDYMGENGHVFRDDTNISSQLSDRNGGSWVQNRVAETIAQSIMLPCLARLYAHDNIDEILGPEGDGLSHPSERACVYMVVKLRQL